MALTPPLPRHVRRTVAKRRRPAVTPKAAKRPVAGVSDDQRRRMERDPNYRSKQPDSALTPAQLKARKLNQRLAGYDKDPLYNPGAQLSGRNLVSAARAIAALETDPAVDALKRNQRSSDIQGMGLLGRAGDYYTQLGQKDAASQMRQAAYAQNLNRETGQIAQTTREALERIGNTEAARAADDATVRGSLGADNRVQEGIAHDSRIAEAVLANAGTRADAQGAAWQELSGLAAQARQMRGGEIQGQLGNRIANTQKDIRERISSEEALRGPRMSKALTELRQQGFENAVTQTGLQIDQDKIDATLAGIKQRDLASRRTAATTRRGQDVSAATTRRGQDITSKDAARARAIDAGRLNETKRHNRASERGAGAKEPESAVALRKGIDGMVGEAADLQGKAGYRRLTTRMQKRTYIQNMLRQRAKRAGQTLPNYIIGPVTDLAEDGHVSARNAEILRSYGVQIPPQWRRTRR